MRAHVIRFAATVVFAATVTAAASIALQPESSPAPPVPVPTEPDTRPRLGHFTMACIDLSCTCRHENGTRRDCTPEELQENAQDYAVTRNRWACRDGKPTCQQNTPEYCYVAWNDTWTPREGPQKPCPEAY